MAPRESFQVLDAFEHDLCVQHHIGHLLDALDHAHFSARFLKDIIHDMPPANALGTGEFVAFLELGAKK